MKKMTIKLLVFSIYACLWSAPVASQILNARITFERKTNLYKKFKDGDAKRWIREEDKIKIDYFELHINDTASAFKPQESEFREINSWTTSKNTVYRQLGSPAVYLVKTIWGEELHLTDSIKPRKWKITENTRNIAGYQCRKAVWQANDSVRIYAWFSYDLVAQTGPETFGDLPGTILGLATEDGGVVYFAKKVEVVKPLPVVFVKPKKKKVYSVTELKNQLTKQYGHEKWFKNMLHEQFDLW
jgi:GLPGLI family protein